MTISAKGEISRTERWSPVDEIKQDLFFRNKNRLIIVVGKPRTGKSMVAVRLAELINPSRFTPATLPKFTIPASAEKFVALVNARNYYNKTILPGDVVIFDEAGVGISSRNWYKEFQKATNHLIQVFGFLRLCVIFTVPSPKMIDSQIRSIFSDLIDTVSIDYTNCRTKVKWVTLTQDGVTGRVYAHHFRHNGKMYPFHWVGLPSKEMYFAYRRFELGFKPKVLDKVEQEVKHHYASEKLKHELEDDLNSNVAGRRVTDLSNIIKEVVNNAERYAFYDKAGKIKTLNAPLIEEDFKIGSHLSSRVIAKIVSDSMDREREKKLVSD